MARKVRKPRLWLYMLASLPMWTIAGAGVVAAYLMIMSIWLAPAGVVLGVAGCAPLAWLVLRYLHRYTEWQHKEGTPHTNQPRPWDN